MECFKHGKQAVAICVNCGTALCSQCSLRSASGKNCCNRTCADEISVQEMVSKLTLERATKSAKAAAYGCYLLGVILMFFAVYLIQKEAQLTVIAYMGFTGLGMMVMGYMMHRSARSTASVNKKLQPTDDAPAE